MIFHCFCPLTQNTYINIYAIVDTDMKTVSPSISAHYVHTDLSRFTTKSREIPVLFNDKL